MIFGRSVRVQLVKVLPQDTRQHTLLIPVPDFMAILHCIRWGSRVLSRTTCCKKKQNVRESLIPESYTPTLNPKLDSPRPQAVTSLLAALLLQAQRVAGRLLSSGVLGLVSGS